MSRLPARLIATMLVFMLVVLGTSTSASANDTSSGALPMGACTTSANAVVAVDFAHWGGPIVRACGSTPTSGFELVNEGGFHTVGTQHDGPGFICRISSSSFGGTPYPAASEPGESCVLTPPATGYWAYWHADAGRNSWSYSSTGATEYSPPAGSVDLWIFGGTSTGGGSGSGVPSFSPNTVRATNTAPTVATTTHASTAHPRSTTTSTSSRASRAPSTPATGKTTASQPATAHSSASHTAARSSATDTGSTTSVPTSATTPIGSDSDPAGGDTTSAADPTVIDDAPTAAKRGSSGSIWPVLGAIAVVALLAGGAGLAVLRRRSS